MTPVRHPLVDALKVVAGTGWVAGLVVAWALAPWVEQPLYRRLR